MGAGMDIEDHEPATTTVTVLFCDLVASTQRVQLVGDDAADHFRRAFFGRLDEAITATHGQLVKNTGDGVMVVFRESAVSAVTCAATMHDKVEALDVDPPAFVRIGVSAGEVAAEHGDYFGTPVVEAARLCDAAQAGQTLVSDVVRVLVGSRGGHTFRSVGALTLKGLTDPLTAAALVRTPVAAPKPVRPARRRARWPYVAAAAAVVLVAAAAAALLVRGDDTKTHTVTPAAAPGYTPRLEPATCSSLVQEQSAGAVCGLLVVPQDRGNPAGKWIKLRYSRYPAVRGATSQHTVVDVGDPPTPFPPGTTGPDNDASGSEPAMAQRSGADLVVMASRGLYHSAPSLDCPEFDTVDLDIVAHKQNDPTDVERGTRALRACYARLVRAGDDPAFYRLTDQAADVVDLIHALQLRSVDLAGGNDGSLVAFQVARVAPDSVRSIALINPAAPDNTFRSDATAMLAEAFDHYVSMCNADAKCRAAYPDLGRAYVNVYHQYEARPLDAIVSGGGLDLPGSRKRFRVRIDGARVAQALAAVFEGDSSGIGLLANGIVHPDNTINAALATAEEYPLLQPHFPWGGFLSRFCKDQAADRSVTAAVSIKAHPEFAGFADPTLDWMCAAWPVPETATPPLTNVNVPVFVARMDLMPRQSSNALDAIRTAIPGVQVFQLHAPTPGGVLGFFPPCYGDLRTQFERDPTRPLDIAACEAHESKIAFTTPSG